MGIWINLVVIAQFILAVVSLIDKYILTSKKVPKPFILSFYVSVLTFFSLSIYLLDFLPFNFGFQTPSIFNIGKPTMALFAMTLVAGYTFFYSLVPLYSSLREADASDVVPVVGSITAITTFILNYLILGHTLSQNFFVGFLFLVAGAILISSLRLSKKVISMCFGSGILFAVNAVMVKSMFEMSSFDQAFFWSRIGTLLVVASLLLVPRYWGKIKANINRTKAQSGLWVVGKSILAGIASLMILKAIDLGNVTIVQALAGLQFAFLGIISFIFGPHTPRVWGENNTWRDILQKAVAITLLLFGTFYLFL